VTAIELVCPILLVLGLAARLAALPMLVMALVIQFVVGAADPAFHLTEHYYWMFLLAVIVTKGPGRLSLDHLLARRLEARTTEPI
jgi:putative oxidoreductase